MKININNTKAMVIGRKPKKIYMQIKMNPSKKWRTSNTLVFNIVAT